MPQTRKSSFAAVARQDRSSPAIQRNLPVFVTPGRLEYILNDHSTHRQIVTVYNPYDFLIHFKVLCTAPKNYHVSESNGIVKPQRCTDIVIRRTNLRESSQKEDKFRVEVSQAELSQSKEQKFATSLLGVKEIVSVIVQKPSVELDTDSQHLEPTDTQASFANELDHNKATGEFLSGKWLMISIAGLCLLALATHTTGQENTASFIPTYYSLSSNQKMVASYILGELWML